jgi:hypothetical protein
MAASTNVYGHLSILIARIREFCSRPGLEITLKPARRKKLTRNGLPIRKQTKLSTGRTGGFRGVSSFNRSPRSGGE